MRFSCRFFVPPVIRVVVPFLALGLVTAGAATSPARAAIPVTGRVVGPGGSPLPEAKVLLLPLSPPPRLARLALAGGSHAEPMARAVTDARGAWRLEVPQAGWFALRIEAPGFAPVAGSLTPLFEETDLEEAELEPDAGLAVSVTSRDGTPISGALVVVRGEDQRVRFGEGFWRPAPRVALTGENGQALLARGAKESLVVGAAAPGRVFATRSGRLPAALSLSLDGPVAAREVVLKGADGTPVEGAVVTDEKAGLPIGFTMASGSASLALPAEGAALSFEATDGRSLATRVLPAPPAPKAPEPLQLAVPALGTVSGRVIDTSTRRPIAGALVYEPSHARLGVVTDAAGRYAIDIGEGGRTELRAVATGYLSRGDGAESVELLSGTTAGPTLALQPSARIEGAVNDASGRGLEGVIVTATQIDPRFGGGRRMIRRGWSGGGSASRALTGAEGRFRLFGLDPSHGYTLRAEKKGFADAEAEITGLVPRQARTGVTIVLRPGARAVGRVVDVESRPIAGAEVFVAPAQEGGPGRFLLFLGGGDDRERPAAVSDADGMFALENLSTGKIDLTVKRRGFASRTVPGIEINEGAAAAGVGDVVLEPGARIEGTVSSSDGAPIEGVEVRALPGGPFPMLPGIRPPGEPSAVTGADGYFAVEDRSAGEKVDLGFWRTGYVTERKPGVEAGAAEPLDVTLRPASKVSGRVLSSDRPVAGARILLTRSAAGGSGSMAIVVAGSMNWAETDDGGDFEIEGVDPGKIQLRISAAGYQAKSLDEIEVPEGADLTGLEIRLEPGAAAEGVVTTADGRPVIGARVGTVESEGNRMLRLMRDSVTTDGDGRYRLEGLATGPVSIEAQHDDYARTVRDTELKAGTNRLDLAFSGGQSVSGRVLDAGGASLAGAFVELHPPGQRWGGPEATTGPDGSFSIENVQDGSYELGATREGFAASSGEVKVEVKGAPVTGLVVTLRSGGAIAGTIQGLDPKEYAGVNVIAGSDAGYGSGSVDFQGNYRIADLAPGRYTVRAMTRDFSRSASGDTEVVAGVPEARLDIDFAQGISLSGRALLGEVPVAGGIVWARGKTVSSFGQARTDAEGKFTIEGLEAAAYEVTLNVFEKGLSYSETVDLTATRDVTLRVPTMRVAGAVTDALDRSPVAGVSVTLASEEEAQQVAGMRFGGYGSLSSEAGRFAISNVAPGTYRLTAKKDGYAAKQETVVVATGRDVDSINFVLDPTEGVLLQVRLPEGGLPEAVFATVLDGAGRGVTSGRYPTGEGGRVRLPTVPPGSWDLLIAAPGTAVAALTVTAPGGPIPVQLSPATQLRIRVPDLEGSKLIASVRVVGTDGRAHRSLGWGASGGAERQAAEGRTTIEDLPAGAWTVIVTAPDGRTWQGAATTTPGRATDLAL